MLMKIRKQLRKNKGAIAVEYVLIAALIVLALVTNFNSLSTAIGNLFGRVEASIDNVVTP